MKKSSNSPELSNDALTLIVGGVIMLPFLGGSLLAASRRWRDALGGWLTDHQLLVPSSAHPRVEIPGLSAGLDTPRLILAVLLVVAVVVLGRVMVGLVRRGASEQTS